MSITLHMNTNYSLATLNERSFQEQCPLSKKIFCTSAIASIDIFTED